MLYASAKRPLRAAEAGFLSIRGVLIGYPINSMVIEGILK
jgi:hypothetical protein